MVVPGCWVAAVGLEFLQVFFPPRTIALNDVVVEGLGALPGALGRANK
jgi:VanZ family protein